MSDVFTPTKRSGVISRIPCLEHSDFPADLLARIYGVHGQRLLERNVRAFLESSGTGGNDLRSRKGMTISD